jgi:hypothetical protein
VSLEAALVSVIIPNHNYAEFVGAAIDSALRLDWPHVEVIVVDDGSTDGSREVIAGFGARILAVYRGNAGQLNACNEGFALARGSIVIFLDADDTLAPSLVREVAGVWHGRVSKVQVQMQVVDARGRRTGDYFPQYRAVPSPQEVRAWAVSTSAYPTPPCSGNAYARWFLERIFPLPEVCGNMSDSCCLAAAPLLGDVVTVAKPLASYRVHGRNRGALSRLDLHQFERQMTRARQRHSYARGVAAEAGIALPEDAIDRSLSYLCYRMASLKLAPATHPLPADTPARVLAHFWGAFLAPQGVSLKARLALLAWACAVALSPRSLARTLVLWRFAPGARPLALRSLLTRLRVVRA